MLEEEFFAWEGGNYVFIILCIGLSILSLLLARRFFKKI